MSMIKVTREDIKQQLNGDLDHFHQLKFDNGQDIALRVYHTDKNCTFTFNVHRIHGQGLFDQLITECQKELAQ